MALAIAIGAAVAAALWLLATYNRLVRLRQYCHESWATVDTELKRRHDLIPGLVAAARGYADHEAQALAAAAAVRGAAAAGTPREVAAVEQPLASGARRLLAVAEGYPELKASANFLALQADLADTEDRIQSSRRIYNANVRELNAYRESFPANLVAGPLGFRAADYFELERVAIRRVVDVSFGGDGP